MKILFELLIVLNVLLALLVSVCDGSLLRGVRPPRRNQRPRTPSWSTCPIPKINNGNVRLQRAGRMGSFYCAQGFEIYGAMSILCASGRWKQDIPICIKAGCSSPQKRSNGLVMLDGKNQKSMLFCQEGFVTEGSSIAFCNGEEWDRNLGECRLDVGHSKTCDFETVNLCGWTQDEDNDNDFQWVQKNGWTSFEKLEYGPKHDHTKAIPLEGHYMVAEATNSRTTQRSRLLSPVHNQTDSENACFHFFYHMYGRTVGRLRIIIKTIDDTMDEVVDNLQNILFEKEGSQGNQWNEGFFEIEPTKTDFQIVIEATGSRGLISDIAIDDVALLKDGDCMKYLKHELVTTEADGIFDTQSCANRCSETESVRKPNNETFYKDGHLIEKCDCHQECIDKFTCCLDYVTLCIENTPTDSDIAINTFDDILMGFTTTELNEVMTLVDNTVKTTTQKPTVATTKTLITSTTPRPTSLTSTTPNPTTTTMKATAKTVTRSTVTRPNQVTNTNISTIPTTTKLFVTKIPNVISVTPNITDIISKTKVIFTKPVKAMTFTTITSKKIFSSTQPTKTHSTAKGYSVPSTNSQAAKQFVTQKENQRSAWVTPSHSPFVIITSTDTTLNAMLLNKKNSDNQMSRGQFAWISTIVLICILSMLLLIGWNQFKSQQWNEFNSQQIEYKSNYHSDEIEEALVRSNSFIIDDSFNETLIDNSIDEGSSPDKCRRNLKSKKSSADKIKINATVPNITKKVSDRLGKNCDQYSEKRCLTIDDEQFDFSLQMHE